MNDSPEKMKKGISMLVRKLELLRMTEKRIFDSITIFLYET